MVHVVVIAMSAWAVLALTGLALLLHLDGRQQCLVMPALPALGTMLGVVILHWPAMISDVPTSLMVGFMVVGLVATVAWRRGGRLVAGAKMLPLLGLALALGVVPFTVALLPAFEIGRPALVQPTPNNDAFAYVSLASWLRSNPALEAPDRGIDAPTFGYARVHLDSGLRIGEQLLQAGVAILNRRDAAATWYATLGAWVLMLPGAYWAAGRVLGMHPAAGAIGGLGAAASTALLGQVYQQNSAAVLGVVMAPLVVILFADAVRDEPALPWWLSSVAMAALAGTYSEYLPVLAPGLALFIVARRPAAIATVIGRSARVLLTAVVMSPFIWYNVARSLVFEARITAPGFDSSFIHAPAWVIVNRVTGAAQLDGGQLSSKLGLLLALVLGMGMLVLVGYRGRSILLCFALGCLAVILFLTFVHRFPYGQQRAVQITIPVLVLAVSAGYERLAGWSSDFWSQRRRMMAVASGGMVVLAATAFPLVNLRSSIQWHSRFELAGRHIDASMAEGAEWISAVGGRRGEGAIVISSNYFEQLWMTYLLRHRPAVAWPFLYPDYMNIERYERWDGRLRRYVLVGRDDYVDVDSAAVIRQNHRFRLLDLTKGDALIGIPSAQWHGAEHAPAGVANWMSNSGQLMLVRTAGTPPRVRIRGAALQDLDPLEITVTGIGGETLGVFSIGSSETEVTVEIPDRPGVVLMLNNNKEARPPAGGSEPRKLSYYLMGVSRG